MPNSVYTSDLLQNQLFGGPFVTLGASGPGDGSNFGPNSVGAGLTTDTPAGTKTTTSGLQEIIDYVNANPVYGTAFLIPGVGKFLDVTSAVFLKPNANVLGNNCVIREKTGSALTSIIVDRTSAPIVNNWYKGWGVACNGETSNAVYLLTPKFCTFNLGPIQGGANGQVAFGIDGSGGVVQPAANVIEEMTGDNTGKFNTVILLKGASGNAVTNNEFLYVNFPGSSSGAMVTGIDINNFADTNTFNDIRINLGAANAVGLSVGTAGTSVTGAVSQDNKFRKLAFDSSGGSALTACKIGYYQVNAGASDTIPGLIIDSLRAGGAAANWSAIVTDSRTTPLMDYDIRDVSGRVHHQPHATGVTTWPSGRFGAANQVAVPASTATTVAVPRWTFLWIITGGTLTAGTALITDPNGVTVSPIPGAATTLTVGMVIIIPPGAVFGMTYSVAPTWKSYVF